MSAGNGSTAGLPDAAAISAAAARVRALSRPVMPTRAPIAASPVAVALPIPPVPPVTRTVWPAIGPGGCQSSNVRTEAQLGSELGREKIPAGGQHLPGQRRPALKHLVFHLASFHLNRVGRASDVLSVLQEPQAEPA